MPVCFSKVLAYINLATVSAITDQRRSMRAPHAKCMHAHVDLHVCRSTLHAELVYIACMQYSTHPECIQTMVCA